MILTVRTDKIEAEIGIYNAEGSQLGYKIWHAHRELGVTIHKTIQELLSQNDLGWADISGIIFYAGPGSFTGLRIGAAVVNALGENGAHIVNSRDEDWIEKGIARMRAGVNEVALPEYGNDPHITQPRK